MKKLIALWALLRIADVTTTLYALDNGAIEANPFCAWLLGQGNLWFCGVEALSVAVLIYIFHNKTDSFSRKVLIVANILAAIVVINNLFTIGIL
jgi:hypothetical protein